MKFTRNPRYNWKLELYLDYKLENIIYYILKSCENRNILKVKLDYSNDQG